MSPVAGQSPRIYVCLNVDCVGRGAREVFERLSEESAARLADLDIRRWMCFGACRKGPNVLVEERRSFYSEVRPDHAPGLVAYALGGPKPSVPDRSGTFAARKVLNLIDAGMRPGDY